MYGGFNPSVSNVYFTNGKIDPWRTVGIQYEQASFAADVISSKLTFSEILVYILLISIDFLNVIFSVSSLS